MNVDEKRYTFLYVDDFKEVVDLLQKRADALGVALPIQLYQIHRGGPVRLFRKVGSRKEYSPLFSLLQETILDIADDFVDPTVDYAAANYTTFPINLVKNRLMDHVPDLALLPEGAFVFNEDTKNRVKNFLAACKDAINLCHIRLAYEFDVSAGWVEKRERYAMLEYDSSGKVQRVYGDESIIESEGFPLGISSSQADDDDDPTTYHLLNSSSTMCRAYVYFVCKNSTMDVSAPESEKHEWTPRYVGERKNNSELSTPTVDYAFRNFTYVKPAYVIASFLIRSEDRPDSGFCSGNGPPGWYWPCSMYNFSKTTKKHFYTEYTGYVDSAVGTFASNDGACWEDELESEAPNAYLMSLDSVKDELAQYADSTGKESEHTYISSMPDGEITCDDPRIQYSTYRLHDNVFGVSLPGCLKTTYVEGSRVECRNYYYVIGDYREYAERTFYKLVKYASIVVGAYLWSAPIYTNYGENLCRDDEVVKHKTWQRLPLKSSTSGDYDWRRPECSNDEERHYTLDGDATTEISWDRREDEQIVQTIEPGCAKEDALTYHYSEKTYVKPNSSDLGMLLPHGEIVLDFSTCLDFNTLKNETITKVVTALESTDFGTFVAFYQDEYGAVSSEWSPTSASVEAEFDSTSLAVVIYDYMF